MQAAITPHASSFRDPSGFIFEKDGVIYRQVNKVFADDFDFFISSGCYDAMTSKGLFIKHETIHENLSGAPDWHLTIKPEQIPFISYPYEWSFDMLKDAALHTLRLAKEGLEWGMLLKDATPYNIQWQNGKLQMIDSLSFEKYDESKPWIAYRQFCEQFLSPLLLAHYAKQPLPGLLLAYPDGIPLTITSAMLPGKTKFSVHTYLHIHLQAKYSMKDHASAAKKVEFSKKKLLNLLNSLEILINKLQVPAQKSTWSAYYDEAGTRSNYLDLKRELVAKWLKEISPKTTADLGANTGEFSKLATPYGNVIAADFDANCINSLYNELKISGEKNILPLIIDLSKPSPGIGLNNTERTSFIDRLDVNLVLALALIHHLAIGKNLPFDRIAEFFSKVCRYLVIEFVPKKDEKIIQMLQGKKDIYSSYHQENFDLAFQKYFTILEKSPIGKSGRILYRMRKHES